MTRVNLILLALLIASSLYLVKTSYEARRLFAAIDRAQGEARQLDIEYKRLDAERQAQGTSARVEKVARDKLQMRTAAPGVTHYVVDDSASRASK